MPSKDKMDIEMEPQPPTRQHILNTAFPQWHATYKKHIPRAVTLKMPKEFVEYLLEDGITLPDDGYRWNDREDEGVPEDESSGDEDQDELPDPTLKFQEFHEQVKQTIADLGGAVTPKLNWSAPKDAQWISTTNNLKCVTASDVYLLLKASSYVAHDLTEVFNDADASESKDTSDVDYHLVLRKWVEMNPSVEFRCFVKDRQIVGITQRDMNYYEFLEPLREKFLDEIEAFFQDVLQTSFSESSFVFDVYVPRPFNRVWLIDINPWAAKTDTLLFSWSQLMRVQQLEPGFEPEFRLVTKEEGTLGFGAREHSENAVPKDIVDASASGEGIAELARQWRQILTMQQQESDGEDADNEDEDEASDDDA